MIFAIYCGNGEGPGRFIKNKIYLAHPEVDNSSVVDISHFELNDEDGVEIQVIPTEGHFVYPDEVYAVVLKDYGTNDTGEVVVIDGAVDGGTFLSVKGKGFAKRENFQLLDMTIVHPGMLVYDREDMMWKEVSMVDECMRLAVGDKELMRLPTEFTFAVSDGDLCAFYHRQN